MENHFWIQKISNFMFLCSVQHISVPSGMFSSSICSYCFSCLKSCTGGSGGGGNAVFGLTVVMNTSFKVSLFCCGWLPTSLLDTDR